jgi:hypothetical protein
MLAISSSDSKNRCSSCGCARGRRPHIARHDQPLPLIRTIAAEFEDDKKEAQQSAVHFRIMTRAQLRDTRRSQNEIQIHFKPTLILAEAQIPRKQPYCRIPLVRFEDLNQVFESSAWLMELLSLTI